MLLIEEHEAKLIEPKGEVDKSTVTVGVFITPFLIIDETGRKSVWI